MTEMTGDQKGETRNGLAWISEARSAKCFVSGCVFTYPGKGFLDRQLRNWANTPDDSMLPFAEIARKIIKQEKLERESGGAMKKEPVSARDFPGTENRCRWVFT